jgi:hypothetical protein
VRDGDAAAYLYLLASLKLPLRFSLPHMRDETFGEEWSSRIEFYLTDPQQEPSPAKWKTEIRFLLTDI